MPAPPKPTRLVPNLEYRAYVESLGCTCKASGKCFGRTVGHHCKTVGAGGKDEFNLVPLCYGVHHTGGIHTMSEEKFEEMYDLPHLRSLAISIGVAYYKEKAVEKLAEVRGLDMCSAGVIILNAVDNIENGTREWVA